MATNLFGSKIESTTIQNIWELNINSENMKLVVETSQNKNVI